MGAPLNSSSESGFEAQEEANEMRLFLMTKGDFNSTHIRQVFLKLSSSPPFYILLVCFVFLFTSNAALLRRHSSRRCSSQLELTQCVPSTCFHSSLYGVCSPRTEKDSQWIHVFFGQVCLSIVQEVELSSRRTFSLCVIFFVHSFSLLFHVLSVVLPHHKRWKSWRITQKKKTLKSLYVWNYCRDYRTWVSDTESRKSIIKQSWTSESFFIMTLPLASFTHSKASIGRDN